jgi:Pyridoxamine 5'-phosphate oxidase
MKIINANPEIPGMSNKEEVKRVLQSKLNLQLATIDETGYPNIQPVWFEYDTRRNRLFILSSRMTKSLNVHNNSKVYFSVGWWLQCSLQSIKDRGSVVIGKDPGTVTPTAEKIGLNYFDTLDHDATEEEAECFVNGYDSGFARKYDSNRARECIEHSDEYNDMWFVGCEDSLRIEEECGDLINNPVETEDFEALYDQAEL